ncbi:hypothetical protein [Paenibacillus wynnii]|uniref:hypothetical protein n=1 Tax=Paenibacillus wynnii TaxID=268407 RepID=UPI0027933644|nr:hypothetical protein [Paenibacillus wynnii]MDQ0196793.1 hypothetical protein [Paenibacillus wynnii]
MKIRGIRLNLGAAVVAALLLLQGCGQNKKGVNEGESFAAAINSVSPQPSATVTDDAPDNKETIQDKVIVASPASSAPPSSVPEVISEPSKKPTAVPSTVPSTAPSATPTLTPKRSTVAPTVKPTSSSEPKVGAVSTAKPNIQGITGIGWLDFFDGEDQTRPSERFWDLRGSQVYIKGFMGEVLSFEKNWFLLIPEPGAECPFDNGDETYWNKIMIVFVPEDVKLRYKSGPLQITGRLDVGIKIDDSGYKTMFRLYDASFKEIE